VGFVSSASSAMSSGTDFSSHVPRRRARAREYSSGEVGGGNVRRRGRATGSISTED